jgi:general secretion pathway protein G
MQDRARERAQDRAQTGAESGFTLIEILIVVTIIGLLMAFVGGNLFGQAGKAKRQLAETQLRKIQDTLELYKLQNGRYPTTEQGLIALVRKPTTEPIPQSYPPGGYMRENQVLDPWGAIYRYEAPGSNNGYGFDLSSLGPDGREGGEGDDADIVNWDVAAR